MFPGRIFLAERCSAQCGKQGEHGQLCFTDEGQPRSRVHRICADVAATSPCNVTMCVFSPVILRERHSVACAGLELQVFVAVILKDSFF